VHTHTNARTHLASVSNLQGAGEKGQQEKETVKMGTALGGKSAGCEHPLSFLSRLGTQPTLQSCHVRRSALEKRERKAG